MNPEEIIGLILILLSCTFILHLISAFILYMINENFPFFYTPKDLYRCTEMNWFGCIMVYIILFPFGFVFEIGGFLRWLFTVGRKG